jgi:hypothetical protein
LRDIRRVIRTTHPCVALVIVALVFRLGSASLAEAQTCQSNQDGTSSLVISESNPEEALNNGFCDGDPGLDFCATSQGILLDLKLTGVANIDVTCELTLPSTNQKGRICIATDGCEESEFVPARTDDNHIRLVGNVLPSTDYKIAVFDIGSDANFCSGSPDLKVTCTGDFGTELQCSQLTTGHTPGPAGSDPTTNPAKSAACPSAGQYVSGESIQLEAQPADGWEVSGWSGTNDNASTLTTNTVTMPARNHQVRVIYAQPRVSFDSGFEKKGFCDWSSRTCDTCDVFSCHLSAGETSVPLSFYQTFVTGEHRGSLLGPEDADFDLVLQWWNGSEWLPVASQLSPEASEEVVHEGAPGAYRWMVSAAAGAGEYALAIDYPGLVSTGSNHIERVKKPRKQRKRSLRAVFDKTSKHRDYLVDSSPGIGAGETQYEASFWIRPETGLVVKGKKHQILQLQRTRGVPKPQPIVELFLRAVRGQQDRYGVSVRAHTDGGGKPKSPLATFDAEAWSQIRVVWRAASDPTLTDGLIELYVGEVLQWSVNLPNAPDVVDRALLGQVTRGSKKTAGVIYLDDFRSRWED